MVEFYLSIFFSCCNKSVKCVNKRGHYQQIKEIYCTLPVTIAIPNFRPCFVTLQCKPHTHIYMVMADRALLLIYSSIVSSVKVLQCGRRRKSEISAYSHWQL